MALTKLPHELLDMIVEYCLPQSFESLATTCQIIYRRCIPFIKRYNELYSGFRDFRYYSTHPRDSPVAASDLIGLIAADPIVARHIRVADLSDDTCYIRYARYHGRPQVSLPSIEDGGPVVRLFSNSAYLQQAGLDWKVYYSTFAEDVREERYSQHGSAFLLTLLCYAQSLTIPNSWEPNAATDQLLDVLANEARQSSFLSSGLRSVTRFQGSKNENRDLSWVRPFLTLPHLKRFSNSCSLAVGESPGSLGFKDLPHVATTLEVVHLGACCIDHIGITDFLKHTPYLKTLRYSHRTQDDQFDLDWDICKFINAVGREAGSHLVELSVKILKLHGSILPGKASTCRFQKLEKFEFPLELVICNINATGVAGNITTSFERFFSISKNPLVRDLIPTSVTHLLLWRSKESGAYDKALDALFNRFRAIRKFQLPKLQEVHIDCSQTGDRPYVEQGKKIVAEGNTEGVVVHLNLSNRHLSFDGDL